MSSRMRVGTMRAGWAALWMASLLLSASPESWRYTGRTKNDDVLEPSLFSSDRATLPLYPTPSLRNTSTRIFAGGLALSARLDSVSVSADDMQYIARVTGTSTDTPPQIDSFAVHQLLLAPNYPKLVEDRRVDDALLLAEVASYNDLGEAVRFEWRGVPVARLVTARIRSPHQVSLTWLVDAQQRRSLLSRIPRETYIETCLDMTGDSCEAMGADGSAAVRVMTYNIWHNNPLRCDAAFTTLIKA